MTFFFNNIANEYITLSVYWAWLVNLRKYNKFYLKDKTYTAWFNPPSIVIRVEHTFGFCKHINFFLSI